LGAHGVILGPELAELTNRKQYLHPITDSSGALISDACPNDRIAA